MALSLNDKKAIVAEVAEVAQRAISAVTADYRGLTVSEMTALRVNARRSGVYLRIVRNTLARRALEGTDFDGLKDKLVGPTVLAFAEHEPSAAARLMRDFVKEHDNLSVKALAVGDQVYEAASLEAVAQLPTKDEALARLAGTLQAPVTKLVRTFAEVPTKLVRVLAAVRDQKQADAG